MPDYVITLMERTPAVSRSCHWYINCHHLSMWLNCLTGLASGIAGIAMKWHVMCMFLMSVPLSPISLRSLCLALGQRQGWMSCSSLISLIPMFAALEGFSLLSWYIGILVYT